MPETIFHTTFSTSQFLLSRVKNGSESGLRSAVSYRFGFNGKENDNEVKGTGNQQDYGMRIYDPRLGRFLSADPLIVQGQEYPELSPYQFASNRPIDGFDLDGLEYSSGLLLPTNPYGPRLPSAQEVQEVVNATCTGLFELAYSSQVAKDLIHHYSYGNGAGYYLSESEMKDIHPVHKSLTQAENFKSKVTDKLADPNTSSVTVFGLKILTTANTFGTLGNFYISVNGTFTETEEGGWTFTGYMYFNDQYDFEYREDAVDGTNNRCAIARTFLSGVKFQVHSKGVKISQSSSDNEIDWFKGVSEENVSSYFEFFIEDENAGSEAGSESKKQ